MLMLIYVSELCPCAEMSAVCCVKGANDDLVHECTSSYLFDIIN